MDFGEVGMDGIVDPKSNGSGFLKKGRSGSGEDQEDLRGSKVAKTEGSGSPNIMVYKQGSSSTPPPLPLLQRSNSLLSGGDGGGGGGGPHQNNMLCFSSSPRSEAPFLGKNGGIAAERSTQDSAFVYSQHTPYAHSRNTGYGSGGLNGPIMGAKGPFTPSQWVELEHQALIYKHIVANVPVPANMLIALKKSFTPYGFYGWPSGSYVPNSLGSGSFHLGFSGNTDPEPGRCRRTDGKKWRCSRDAVSDQKYCERHINRGRHRSRKPVEGRSGQAVSGSAANVAPIACSAPASVISSSGASSSLVGITQHQFKGLQPGADTPSANVLLNRMQNPQGLSVVSPTTNLKAKDSPFSIPKQHIPVEESLHSHFRHPSSNSLFTPSHNSTNSRNYNPLFDSNDHESRDQNPLRPFIDEWPKDQSSRATVAWPEELKSDWTQLSMSTIPLASSDFSSTSSSSPQEKIALSPLRLSRELDSMQNGSTVGNGLSDSTQKQTNWIPISWGSSIGGPLGEVLNSTTSGTLEAYKNPSTLNLPSEVWNGSPQLGCSPTGVLQKTPFVSLSNSSSGSSPRADNKKTLNESVGLGDYMLSSSLASSFTLPL